MSYSLEVLVYSVTKYVTMVILFKFSESYFPLKSKLHESKGLDMFYFILPIPRRVPGVHMILNSVYSMNK